MTATPYRKFWLPDLAWIVGLALVATVPFLGSQLDVALQAPFFHPLAERRWPDEFARGWRLLYLYGTWPGILVAVAGLVVFVAAPFKPFLARWRRHGLYLLLVLVIGPGFLVNTVFKDHWGRPRPRQIKEFGGPWEHQPVLKKGVGGRGKSFPCGHSSTGYYFVAFYFLARRKHARWAIAALAGAAAWGTLIGVARMAAGAHFASDVLWSAVFTSLAAWFLYYVVLRIPWHEDQPARTTPARPAPWLLWCAPLVGGATIAMGLLGTPAFTEIRHREPEQAPAPARVELDLGPCAVNVVTRPAPQPISLTGEIQGFGWPSSRIGYHAARGRTNDAEVLRIRLTQKGYFTELHGTLTLTVPSGVSVVDLTASAASANSNSAPTPAN